jgi:hypothetical protein
MVSSRITLQSNRPPALYRLRVKTHTADPYGIFRNWKSPYQAFSHVWVFSMSRYRASGLQYCTVFLSVRSCVLIKPRPKKSVFPDRFVWTFSHKGLSKIWGRFLFPERLSPFFSGSEAPLTRCPDEADGKKLIFLAGA